METTQNINMDEQKLRQLFKNKSNCYADAEDVIQAMDEDCFVETVNEVLQQASTVEVIPKRIFYIDEVRKLINKLFNEECTMSRFVEILNEKATGIRAIELYKLIQNNQLTEDQLVSMGWVFDREYNHDQYNTKRYKLGFMEIEFTYEGEKLVTCDLSMKEVQMIPINFNQAKKLTEVFVKY